MSARLQPKVIKAWAIKDDRFGIHIRDMHTDYDDAAIRARLMNAAAKLKREFWYPVPVEIRELTGDEAQAQSDEEEVNHSAMSAT